MSNELANAIKLSLIRIEENPRGLKLITEINDELLKMDREKSLILPKIEQKLLESFTKICLNKLQIFVKLEEDFQNDTDEYKSFEKLV